MMVKAPLSLLILVSLTVSALADRYECYPTYQSGGGDTRRIVVDITLGRSQKVTDFSVTHQLGSGGSRDRSIQYDNFDWRGTLDITWTGERRNDNGDRVYASGTFSYRTRNYTETLNVPGKGVVARIRAVCNRF
jgi:hypothetical protein